MYLNSNLTAEESLRLYGRLSRSMVEDLLERSQGLEDAQGAEAHIQEAMAQFPAEDFLSPIIERLNELRKNLRGANKEELGCIIESLDDLAQCTFNAVDYGRDELRKALEGIGA